jgi:hypothetical protein
MHNLRVSETELEWRKENLEPLKNTLKEYLSDVDGNTLTMTEVFDHVTCLTSHGHPLPTEFNKEVIDKLSEVSFTMKI